MIGLVLLAVAVTPARVANAPVIDGRLDDVAWAAAAPFAAFTQKAPADGAAPTERTELRLAYDDRDLYVAIDCPQHTPVIAVLTRRDRPVETDRVAISLDTRRDGKSAVHFEVSAAGGLADGLRFDDTELSWDWDGNWEAAVTRRADGWSAELRIPLALLRPSAAPSQTWGLQARRYVAGRGEIDELAWIPRDVGGEVSRYAAVGPFERMQRPLGLELQPFALARGDRGGATTWDAAVGLDARARITSGLAVDVALLPDFGQVEADQVVLQLANVETFFPEKRPFFLQGLDLFATPHTLLYTRRIGTTATQPTLAAAEALVRAAPPSPLLAAAKLSGTVGAASTVAAMTAITGATDADVATAAGPVEVRRAAPVTLFAAARGRRDLGEHIALGVFAGAVTRFADAARDAYVGSADAWWRSADGDVTAVADVFATRLEGGAPVRLDDGTTIASGATAPGGRVLVEKQGGRWIGQAEAEVIGRRVDISDLGYLARQNLARGFVAVGHHDTTLGRVLRDRREQLEVYGRVNLDGLHLGSGYQLNSAGTFRNQWAYFVELHDRPAHFDDREVGDGTALERDQVWGLELELSTDPQRALAVASSATLQWLPAGHFIESSVRITAHVAGRLELALEPTLVHADGEPRVVGATPTGDRLLGRQRATGLGAVVRASYAFSPRLTLQAFGQVYADALDYHDFATAPAVARRVRLADLVATSDPAEDPDVDGTTLNITAVLRWEWRLGSTAHLVFSRAQARDGDGTAATDTVLAKLSYWWGG